MICAVNVPGNPKGQPRVKATMRGATIEHHLAVNLALPIRYQGGADE